MGVGGVHNGSGGGLVRANKKKKRKHAGTGGGGGEGWCRRVTSEAAAGYSTHLRSRGGSSFVEGFCVSTFGLTAVLVVVKTMLVPAPPPAAKNAFSWVVSSFAMSSMES